MWQRRHPQEAGGDQPEIATQPEAWKIRYEKSWLHRHCSSVLRRDKQAQKAGQLFSGLLAMNVVFLGSAFICSMIFNKVAITLGDVWIFLSILKIVALGWIAYYLLFTRRKPHAILYRDAHAGPVWVKGSLMLFGVCSILLNVFRMGYDIIHLQCKSQLEILFPCIEILFIGIQTYFIWRHAKDCTQVQHNLTRCGLMLTMATNFLLWLVAVTNDSIHREIDSELNKLVRAFEGNMTSSCRCPNTTVCKIFQKGYILLYPFNTEYCLISCSMLYVMWKNVGRRITQHPAAHSKPKFKIRGLIFGPLLGISAVIIGICIFMLYQIQATSSSPSYHVFVLYYSYYLILLPLMAVGALTGTIIHGLEERELDTLKNPTRSLDVILLMGAALGQIGISYFSIVAIVATNPTGLLNSIILAYSVCLIIQHITQNIFIIEGLHRQPLVVDKASSYNPHAMQGSTSTQSPPNDHPITLRSSQESDPSMANKEVETKEGEKCEDGSSKAYGLEIRQEIRRASQAYVQNWKRKALQEISSFLIMCNIILWIMPSFGAHPEFENGLEKSFYGYSTWFAIVNFGLPLGVFYRMHSVGDLMEVYRSV
ncbi:proton channel OTOP3 isoform X1 [Sphaerodactylus townsendi]|uniref:Proton channel otop3 n=1 Tax=Sphaerodactylus townsendi TaxID=933632 RepID=A0ACB8EKK0_9SAUR|nr:proton channel OTOP3 isoform X1 [Sphaerodactylus townsendi]XP_048348053.1 proton channel OTOP3 isoform X1 [Sphaerodactylus townsendi]